MAKYQCPKCGFKGIEEGMPKCPECGKTFKWSAAQENKKPAKKKDTSKNYLLNFYYWFQTLTYICPIAGLVIWILNKDYKNNINRNKAQCYDRFTKKVFISLGFWVILIIALAVMAAISYNKAKQGA